MMFSRKSVRFVKILSQGKTAIELDNAKYHVNGEPKSLGLSAAIIRQLVSEGVLKLEGAKCHATCLARNWVKRQMSEQGAYLAQHSDMRVLPSGQHLNINEGPLLQLSHARNNKPAFLAPHHLLAAGKIQQLMARCQMVQRTTLSYDPTRTGKADKSLNSAHELGDNALDARRKLNACLETLPADCAGVVMDVCGYQKGLQLIETERNWPRRSAKLILRIGLEQVCLHFGIDFSAQGKEGVRTRKWMQAGTRPRSFLP